MKCENCGIPEGSYSTPGYTLTLQFMPQVGEKWKRQQRRTVWVCGSACAVQTMAIAAMGLPTHKWPMSLREFASQMEKSGQLDFLKPQAGLTVTKIIDETRINTGPGEGEFLKVTPQHREVIFVTQQWPLNAKLPRRAGRPRMFHPLSPAERSRRYRQHKENHEPGREL